MLRYGAIYHAFLSLFVGLLFASVVAAQTSSAPANSSCNTLALQTADSLTAKQRGCYLAKRLLTPEFFLNGAASAAFDQYRNSPFVAHEKWSKFPHRVETFYARHAGRDAAESLVDYLHHEDPRPHFSGKNGFWRRTDAAVMSVLTSPDDDGHWRPAYGPIAGSFSSAFIGSIMYRHNETLPNTLEHATGVYGLYFARAFCNEFKPEMIRVAHHLLPKR